MFSENRRLAIKRYKEFVYSDSPDEINEILGRKKLPSTLGSERFIEWVKKTFSAERRHLEVPQSRSLAPDVQRIKEVVCRSYNVKEKALTEARRGITNEPRNVAVYLVRHLRGDSLEKIAREFMIAKYSTVSSVIKRTRTQILRNRKLKKRVENLKNEINMSQGKT